MNAHTPEADGTSSCSEGEPRASVEQADRLVARGALQPARDLLLQVIERYPRCFEAYDLLARLLERTRQWRALAHTLESMLRLKPTEGQLWRWLGDTHAQGEAWASAIVAFQRALHLQPDDCETLSHLVMAFVGAQRTDDLPPLVDQLLTRFPEQARAHLIKGHFEKINGRADGALRSYEAALRRDSNLSEAMFNLVDTSPPHPDSHVSRRIRRFAKDPDRTPADVANACFALGRIAEAAGQVDEAFRQYQRANGAAVTVMRELGVSYDPIEQEQRAAQALQRYPRAATTAGPRSSTAFRPVFIVGMPRSGTSLVEQILACHSQVSAGGELPYLPESAAAFADFLTTREQIGAPDPTEPAVASILRRLRTLYTDRCFEHNLDRALVTDKLPMNFWSLGFIRLLFPEAIIVHCIRDPMATCWSLYRANFGHHLPYYNSFDDLAHQYGLYMRLMEHWEKVLDPAPVKVKYEELIREPKTQIAALLDACALPVEASCFEPHALPRPVFTASQIQVRKPIQASCAANWRPFEAHLQPLRKLLEAQLGASELHGIQ